MGEKKDWLNQYGLLLFKVIFAILAVVVLGMGVLALVQQGKQNKEEPQPTQDVAVYSDTEEAAELSDTAEIDENIRDYLSATNQTKKRKKVKKTTSVPSKAVQETSQVSLPSTESANNKKTETQIQNQVRETMSSMTISEKIQQLFLITPEQLTKIACVTEAKDPVKMAIEEEPVGGLIFFTSNLKSKGQVLEMLSDIKSYYKIPPFLAVDEEGGTVARVAESGIDVPKFSDMKEIGDTADVRKATEVGETIGAYLTQLGFNLDFAPDADVVENVADSAIGTRSFGSDAELVARMVAATADGLQQNNVSACLKHFPGLGAVSADTHDGSARYVQSLEDLERSDLLPFQEGIAIGTDFIMVGHGSYPNVTGDDTPASLSSIIITDLLRKKMEYDGIVITDALNMGAITNLYESGEAAVCVLQAGADMLLMPQDYNDAYRAVWNAVEEGKIQESRIDASVERILTVKYKRETE